MSKTKLTLYMDEDIVKSMKKSCIEMDISLSRFLENFCCEYLDSKRSERDGSDTVTFMGGSQRSRYTESGSDKAAQ